MMASNINSCIVLAVVFSISLLRSNCIIRNCPRYRALRNSVAKSVMKPHTFKTFSSYQDSAGSDSLGFSSILQKKAFVLPSQVIFGSNAIEHGINLIEEKTQNVLLVSGWNSARLDPILWELEPRGFQLETCCISDEPTVDAVHSVVAAALASNCGAIIAMGCGSVIDTAKMATMLINSHKASQSLAEMTPSQLGTSLLSRSAADNTEPHLDAVLLVTIPALPSMGAELSAVAALRHDLSAASSLDLNGVSATSTADFLNDPLSAKQQEPQRSRRVSKTYIHTRSPDLCLIQPSLTYRAPMELVHDRLLGLISTSIDIILSDPGFMPELLAWDSLRQLMLLLDKAVERAEIRFTQSTLDSVSFETQTVHDDEKDHRSQHFRRYGHGFDLCVIEDLCRVGAAVASARCAIHVGGLQHLSDCMGQRSGVSKGHTRRLGQLLPSYLLAILKWSESENENDGDDEGTMGQQWEQSSSSRKFQGRGQGKDDPYKAFIRTKLDRISQIFQSSKYIADIAPVGSINAEKSGALEANGGEREIVGETSGQSIPSTAQTASLPSSKVLRTSLVHQMQKLADNLRLLAGPLGDREEMEDRSDTEGGDSLSQLRMKLLADPSSASHIPLDRFNPDEFEKEEKMNFVVTDYISEEETVMEGAGVNVDSRQRVRRDLPLIRLTESEGYKLKREIRESCGEESPVSRLSVKALIALLSYPDTDGASTDTDTVTYTGETKIEIAGRMEIVNRIEEARRSDDSGPRSGGSDPTTMQDRNTIGQSSSTSSDDGDGHSNSDSDSSSVGSNSSNSNSHSTGDASHSGAGISAPSDPKSLAVGLDEHVDPSPDPHPLTAVVTVQDLISVPAPPSQFLSDFLAVQSALRTSGLGPGAEALTSEVRSDPALELRISSTGSASARKAGVEGVVVPARGNGFATIGEKGSTSRVAPKSPAAGDIERKNVTEDPAAVHRRKVKQRLASLASSAGSSGDGDDSAGERKKEGVSDSSTASERSLLEEQTDILARLVEQRIHDRWVQAAKPPTPPLPFRR